MCLKIQNPEELGLGFRGVRLGASQESFNEGDNAFSSQGRETGGGWTLTYESMTTTGFEFWGSVQLPSPIA